MKSIVIALIALSSVAAKADYCGANTTSSTYISCNLTETVAGRVTAQQEESIGMNDDLGVLKSQYIQASVRSTFQGAQIFIQGRSENVPTSRTFDYSVLASVCNADQEIANKTFTTVNAKSQAVVANITCRVIKNTQQD